MGSWKALGVLGLAVLAGACSGRAPDKVVAPRQVPEAKVVSILDAGGELTSLDYDAARGLVIAGLHETEKADGTCDSSARVWDARSRRMLHTLGGQHACHVDVAAARGPFLLTTSDEARVWDATTGELHSHLGPVESRAAVAMDPEHDWIATISDDRYAASIRSLSSGVVLHKVEHGKETVPGGPYNYLEALAWSPGGDLLVTMGPETVQGWDPVSGNRRWKVQRNQEWANYKDFSLAYAFSRDGKFLLTGGVDNAFRLWETSTGRMLQQHSETGESVTLAVAIGPDETFFATGDEAGKVRLWDLPEGKLRRTLIDNGHGIQSLRFGRNGRLLAAACLHGHIHLWDLRAGRLLHRVDGEHFAMDPPDADLMVAKEGGKIAFIQAQGLEP